MIKQKIASKKVEICTWCREPIGTNELRCLKCQGYLKCKEDVRALIEKKLGKISFSNRYIRDFPEKIELAVFEFKKEILESLATQDISESKDSSEELK